MKHILLMLFLFVCLCPMTAQTEYISNSRDLDADCIENLNGQYGLLLLSKHQKLMISVVNASKKVDIIYPTQVGENGFYEYRVILDKEDTHQAKVEVNRRGDVYKTEFVANLKPDFMIAYRIEEIASPIRMEQQTKGNDAYLDATAAEVEFTTNIKNLIVKCPDLLEAKITRKTNLNDKDVNIISVVFPIKKLLSAREKVEKAEKEYDELTQKINSNQATDADYDRHDLADKACQVAENELRMLTSIEIYSDNTNHLVLDISDMGPRSKKCYAVLPLVIEKEVFKTECSAYMTEGARLFDMRKYNDARVAYINAITSKDVVINMKPAIKESISLCDSCIRYEKLAAFSISKILKMQKEDNATQDAVAKYASAAIAFLDVVNNYNPNDFYTSRIEKLKNLLEDMPLKISFTTVEWRTITEGDAIPDVEIWAYYGMDGISSIALTSAKKFKKIMSKAPEQYKQEGLTDTQGRALIELDRTKLPLGFVFCPSTDEDIKITYISLNDLMRQAQGTYLEKQFRLKMYKRTNKYF